MSSCRFLSAVLLLATTGLSQTGPAPQPIPEHVAYQHIFRHLLMLKQKSDDAQKAGKDRSELRHLVRKEAGLDEAQGKLLEAAATQCEAEVAEQDAKARVVINRFRAKFPFGIVPKGAQLPPPPPELAQMQQERNQIILLARDQLRNVLGEEGFAKLDAYVKKASQNATVITPAH